MEKDLLGPKSLLQNAENDKSKQNSSKGDISSEKMSEKLDLKKVSNKPEVSDDEDSVDFLNSSHAELIVIDESGGEDGSANGEIVADGKADSDIEIVSDRATPMSTASIDSIPYEGENPCFCKECPYKRKLRHARKKSKKVSKEFRKMKWEKNFRVVDIGQSATVEIRFSDESLFTKYAQEVDTFIKSIKNADHTTDVTLNSSNHSEPGCSFQLYEKFCVDRKGLKETPFHMEWSKPTYEQEFSEVLTEKSFEETPKDTGKRTGTCFNCMGDHMVMDCLKPHDRQRIIDNRNEFRSKRPNINCSRYHVEEGQISKFSQFRPGNLSHELQCALGVSNKELPLFIYKMRILGYPPGWLKEAEIHSSGLTVYGSEGKVIDKHLEDGEVDDPEEIKVQYDAEKLIAFPGFNVTPPQNTIDKCQQLGFPPIQQKHMKEFMEKTILSPAKIYKRKNLKLTPLSAKRQKVSHESQDMDVEEIQTVLDDEQSCEFIAPEPLSTRTTIPSDVVESPCSSALMRIASDSSTPISSPGSKLAATLSLDDLESAKQKLMVELNDSTFVEEGEVKTSATDTTSVEEGEVKTSATDTQSSDEDCRTPKDGTTFLSSSKSMHLGSPAIYQASAFTKLPNAQKFAVGISEHLYFENLPDSTGNFDKMRGVLQNLRERMAALQQ